MTTTQNYTTKEIFVKNTKYIIIIASGHSNYISVRKKMGRSVMASLGKEFKNFDEAIANYKNPQLKLELLKLQLGF
jgi:hypothetical protein